MDHTTNTCCQFNKYAVRSNVFNNTGMFASFREFSFNFAPWIFCHLFDRKTHLACVFIKRYNFSFVFIIQFKEFFCIDRSVSPCNFTYVYQTFHTRHNFKESTVVFNIYYFTFYNFTFFNCFS